MTRRRLWTLTALACGVIILASLPGATWRALGEHAVTATRNAGPFIGKIATTMKTAVAERMPQELNRDTLTVLAPIAGGMLAVALGLMLRRGLPAARQRSRCAAQRTAQRMARRGREVAAIARRTRLAQDAVRDLIGPESSRDAVRESPRSTPSFAATLRDASWHPSA